MDRAFNTYPFTPEELEASSNQHALDSFRVRFLSTGRLAVYGNSLVAIVDSFEELRRVAPLAKYKLTRESRVVKTHILNLEIEL